VQAVIDYVHEMSERGASRLSDRPVAVTPGGGTRV
jgi:hypothetical protein